MWVLAVMLVFTSVLDDEQSKQSISQDTVPTGLCILRDRVIDHCTPTMEKMFGFAPGTLKGKLTRCLFESDETYLENGRTVYLTIEKTGRFASEEAYIRQNGERFWVWEQGKTIFYVK